ncbi:MAG: hypothetical protein ACOX88_00705 [Christensenellales bacterium]|jgi:hypothetical protein
MIILFILGNSLYIVNVNFNTSGFDTKVEGRKAGAVATVSDGADKGKQAVIDAFT